MAATGSNDKVLVTVMTSDNVEIKVEREVIERSILIKNLLEDLGGDNNEAIPVPNVSPYRVSRSLPHFANAVFTGERVGHEEGHRVVRTPQERSCRQPGRRLGLPKEVDRHR